MFASGEEPGNETAVVNEPVIVAPAGESAHRQNEKPRPTRISRNRFTVGFLRRV